MSHSRSERGAISVGVGVVMILITIAGVAGAWWVIKDSDSPNPQGITIEVTSARGARDVNGDPFGLIDYKIDYQSNVTAQAQPSVPEVRCEMRQVQTSRTRVFVGGLLATGSSRIVTGTVTIAAGADNRSIEGEYKTRCQLIRDEKDLLAQDNGPSLDIPAPDDQPADLSYTGRYDIGPPAGSPCVSTANAFVNGQVFEVRFNVGTRIAAFTDGNGYVLEVPINPDGAFEFTVPERVESPGFGGKVIARFVTTIDRVTMEGTMALRRSTGPDCDYSFVAPRQDLTQ